MKGERTLSYVMSRLEPLFKISWWMWSATKVPFLRRFSIVLIYAKKGVTPPTATVGNLRPIPEWKTVKLNENSEL